MSLYSVGTWRSLTVPCRYHWGFLIGPKIENETAVPGMRYHVKNPIGGGWIYEELKLRNVRNTTTLLARIVIGKVTDEDRLVQIIRSTLVVQNDPNWRCRTWVADVLSRAATDGGAVGTAELSWPKIETVARDYVARKIADGRYGGDSDPCKPKPTWDMLQGREVVP